MKETDRIEKIINSNEYSLDDFVFIATYMYNTVNDFDLIIKVINWIEYHSIKSGNCISLKNAILECSDINTEEWTQIAKVKKN